MLHWVILWVSFLKMQFQKTDAIETDRGLGYKKDLFLPVFLNKLNSDLKLIFLRDNTQVYRHTSAITLLLSQPCLL